MQKSMPAVAWNFLDDPAAKFVEASVALRQKPGDRRDVPQVLIRKDR